MHLKYASPANPLSAGFNDIGDYVLVFVTNNALQQFEDRSRWLLVRRSLHGHSAPRSGLLWLTTVINRTPTRVGAQAGCSTSAHSACSVSFEAFSLDADYRFNKHFDAYLGAMYSGVDDGVASGYLNTTNINPTVGVRYKF